MRDWRWPKRGEVFGTEMRLLQSGTNLGGDAAARCCTEAHVDSLTIHYRANGSRLSSLAKVEIPRLLSLQRSCFLFVDSPAMC